MASIFDILAEQHILDAVRNGDFDNLPGAGRPLVFDDELFVSPEQRMVNHILRNAGFTPPEIGLRKEIATLRGEIDGLAAGDERRRALRLRLATMIIQLQEMGR
ncbi:MAG: DnaJ family domain-containing protein [Thauera sp.]